MKLFILTALLTLQTLWAASGLDGGIKIQYGANANTNIVTHVTISPASSGGTNLHAGAIQVTNTLTLGAGATAATLATDTNGTIQATSIAASDNPLFQVKGIGATNQAILGPAGTLYLGNGINVFNGGVIYDGDNIVSYHSPAYDGHSDWAMIVGATELQTEIGGAYSDVYFNGNENETAGYAEMIMETSSANDVDRNRWTIHAEVGTNQKFQFTGGDSTGNGGTLVSFTPLVADGTTPYQMLVSSNHTSGNLAEWGRLGDTPKIQLTWDGAIMLAATTNQITFGATNTVPSNTNAVRWISVKIAGDSSVYGIPLAKY